ncbi:MAG: Hsp70 family protein [Polyangiaceae bacterium]
MSEPSGARFLVGIDLGTTHTVVAFAPLEPSGDSVRVGAVELLEIPQRVSATERASRSLLPSCLYARLDDELPDLDDDPWIAGEFARKRGAEVPGRLVASAKSWLCHPSVDRSAPILPWGSDGRDDEYHLIPKISPVDASARYLEIVRDAWNASHPRAPLEDQEVVLTVPASFDAAARELTIEATKKTGLSVRLLEEPQAAFYDWMHLAGVDGLDALVRAQAHVSVLVVDIGGGTTDLSIIKIDADDHQPHVRDVARVAVGDHLLLGGDNMDLALALHAEPALLDAGQRKLDPQRFGQLVLQCRAAKESLLSNDAPAEISVSVLGSGSKLIGGARRTTITREQVIRWVVDGFFPIVPADASPAQARGGLVSLGLPYAKDSAISKHLAQFISRAGAGWPSAVLFNGGVFKAPLLVERVRELLGSWQGAPVRVLEGTDPDLAVARGAVAYAAALRGVGRRIGGGSAHTYYVGLSDGRGERRAMCVIPRGGALGHRYSAPRALSLLVGQTARFELFSRADSNLDQPGDVIALDDEHHVALPPVSTRLGAQSRGVSEVMVHVEGEMTEVGSLDLGLRELDANGALSARVHRLAFQLRGSTADDAPKSIAPSSLPPATMPPPSRGQAARRFDEAATLLLRVFGKAKEPASEREVKDLVRELERLLGERQSWTIELTRSLFDVVAPWARNRKRSPEHERQFWSLAGFCLRPGYGDVGDESRIALLEPLANEGVTHVKDARVFQQMFIAWRRVAGGLDEPTQLALREIADPHLSPGGVNKKKVKPVPSESLDELLAMAASLERVPSFRRAELGSWVLEKTFTRRESKLWDALGRIGARVPSRASAHYVVSARHAEEWLDELLRDRRWEDLAAAPLCAARLARKTGDRTIDVSERARNEVVRRLRAMNAKETWVTWVSEVVADDATSTADFLGESLPVGLRLLSYFSDGDVASLHCPLIATRSRCSSEQRVKPSWVIAASLVPGVNVVITISLTPAMSRSKQS